MIEYCCGSIGYAGGGVEVGGGAVVGHVIVGLGVDAIEADCGGHVEDGVAGCGGVGHDVGGVVHGYIAQVEKNYNGRSHNKIHNRIQFLNLKVVRCANPGPCSSQPQGHKTAFKFQRIRCTICLTSPDNQKKETTPGRREPAFIPCHAMKSGEFRK